MMSHFLSSLPHWLRGTFDVDHLFWNIWLLWDDAIRF
jgi:hypothetical protein